MRTSSQRELEVSMDNTDDLMEFINKKIYSETESKKAKSSLNM